MARDSEEREAVRGLLSMSMSVMHARPEERGGMEENGREWSGLR